MQNWFGSKHPVVRLYVVHTHSLFSCLNGKKVDVLLHTPCITCEVVGNALMGFTIVQQYIFRKAIVIGYMMYAIYGREFGVCHITFFEFVTQYDQYFFREQ